jgi:hypothetical protein
MQIKSLGKNVDLVVLGERQDVDQRASFLWENVLHGVFFGGKTERQVFFGGNHQK